MPLEEQSKKMTGKAPSLGKGRNVAETISFGPDRSGHTGQRLWEEREARTPYENHSLRFKDTHLAPSVLPGEVPGGGRPGTRRYRPLPSPPAGGLGTQSQAAAEFKEGKLTLSSATFTASKGTYLYGHAIKCPDLEKPDIDTPGPGSYHDVTRPSARHGSTYQGTRGSSNMFGPQVNSKRGSAPMYRFGEQAWPTKDYRNYSELGKKTEEKPPPTIDDSLFYMMLRKANITTVPEGKQFYKNMSPTREMAPASR